MDDQNENDVSRATVSALLSHSQTPTSTANAQKQSSKFQEILPKFSSPLKTNFENLNLWLRFGLTLKLSDESPQCALQAFIECLRIDQNDPLPAMLAAKLLLEDLDDPERGIEMIEVAIRRCQNHQQQGTTTTTSAPVQNPSSSTSSTSASSSLSSTKSSSTTMSIQQQQQQLQENHNHNHYHHHQHNAPSKLLSQPRTLSSLPPHSCYKNVAPLLSRCYLLASIMHAHIYEREPESIKQFKSANLKASLNFLDLAIETNPNDYLAYFHKALHDARQRSYQTATDNIRRAIRLNPYHMPSMQLLILSLSALKLYDEALVLCESTLQEYENNLLLLYIKCNLEQCLVETKGYKTALSTAQQMLKCIRRSVRRPAELAKESTTIVSAATTATNNTASAIVSNTTNAATATTTVIYPNNPVAETKPSTNLFADDVKDSATRQEFQFEELSVWLLVAEIFVKIGSIEDAEMCVDEGSIHATGALSHQVMFIRGLISKARNNLIEAKTFFQSCLALYPRHAKALQQLAHVHYLLGNHSTAEKFLKDSLDVDNDCYKTWHYLSLVLIEQNLHDKANECVKKSTVLEESSPVISLSAISRLTLQ